MTEEKFLDWYKNGTGFFTYCRGSSLTINEQSLKLKTLTWQYAVEGRLILLQKRHGKDDYEYLAQKRKYRNDKLTPLNYRDTNSNMKFQNRSMKLWQSSLKAVKLEKPKTLMGLPLSSRGKLILSL